MAHFRYRVKILLQRETPMTIIRHEFKKTDGLEKEMDLHDNVDEHRELLNFETAAEFLGTWPNRVHQSEIESVSGHFGPASRVLDIGAGAGYTSVYFATLGHKVSVVEPSYALCTVIDRLAVKFGLDITVHQCSMESFTSDQMFDLCLFNASFHHCDRPLLALENCRAVLSPGGYVYLVNEQVLKFYRSKKWYETIRQTSPEKVCDYGGNEHTYRIHEYRSMIRKSGFRIEQEKIPVYYLHPKMMIATSILINDIFTKDNGKELYSDLNIFIRFIFYMALKRLVTFPVTRALLKLLSLIGVTFIGKKV
jgi:SAM-dependent methyltransferase